MPKVNYHVLKDTELRKYCRDLNLPSKGEREVLVWRHRQYSMRHNACCDGMEPPDKAGIVSEIEQQERGMPWSKSSGPSIFSRAARGPSRDTAADSGERDTSQDAAFEELMLQIEQRRGKKRKRVYTYGEGSNHRPGL